jgi:hypothetical protein
LWLPASLLSLSVAMRSGFAASNGGCRRWKQPMVNKLNAWMDDY